MEFKLRFIFLLVITGLLLGLFTVPVVAKQPDPPGMLPPKVDQKFDVWICYPSAPSAWWVKQCRDWGWKWWDLYYKWNEDYGKSIPHFLLER